MKGDLIFYRQGYKATLDQRYSTVTNIRPPKTIRYRQITLDTQGRLTLDVGFPWNFANGPTFNTENCKRGTAIHDALYRLMNLGLLDWVWKEEADLELYIAAKEDGMCHPRARLWLAMVRKFGGASKETKHVRRSAPIKGQE